jgi:Uri superfamily endonuclease
MPEGTYTLLVKLPTTATVAVGALGEQSFPAGWYAYTGSAFGPGGFARVDRHHEMAAGERDARHWHVDYLLGDTDAEIRSVVRTPDRDIECAVADAVDGRPVVHGFGSSDCDCPTHLHHAADRATLVDSVKRAHRTV